MAKAVRLYCFSQNMDRKKFIDSCVDDFLNSECNRIILSYRTGIPDRERRYITRKIGALVEMEKTSAHIETYPDVPPRVFAKHVEMQKQQDDKCFSIDDTDKVFRTVRMEQIIEQSSHKDW